MAFNLSEYVNVRYAVMLLGVVLFGIGILMGWHEIRTLVKVLLVLGAIAFFVGMKSSPATTPTQIIERIPQYFPQLQPTLQPQLNPQTGQIDTTKPAQLVFDAPQAKILNDTLVDCKVCQVERDKLKLDLADQKSVTAERTKEVETWKTAAKGGSIWKRSGRVLKWGIIFFGIGYAVAKH